MRRGILVVVLVAALAAALVGARRGAADPVWAGVCGIRSQQTVWAEYGWPTLLPILARPGTLLAVTQLKGSNYAAEARARGAATYSFDLHLKDKVGTPVAPADPATLEAAAQKAYDNAVSRSGGCATPLVVENELFGASLPTPWDEDTVQYRADVLAFLQDLARLGAHPVLLVAKQPFAGSPDATAWWLQVARVSDIVREVYIPATAVWGLGPVLGNRFLRERYREAALGLTSIGIPANRVGLMLSFLSAKGGGGRNGIQPASKWFEYVKWQALSVKEVASELRLGSVFSWGWQQWNPKERDPAKKKAACVWLWARSRHLCDAPKMLGPSFDVSLHEGQLDLAAGDLCSVPGLGTVREDAVRRLQAVTGDRAAALSALFGRLVASAFPVQRRVVLAAEQRVIGTSFGGSRPAYLAALRAAHANVDVARSILADELRRAEVERLLHVQAPGTNEIATFYSSYPDLPVRRVRISPEAPWVGGVHEGWAAAGAAPQRVFDAPAGRKSVVHTLAGTYTVRPLGAVQQLGSLPLATVRPAVAAALRVYERAQAFGRWTIDREKNALRTAVCRRDELPAPAAIDLTTYLPFLELP